MVLKILLAEDSCVPTTPLSSGGWKELAKPASYPWKDPFVHNFEFKVEELYNAVIGTTVLISYTSRQCPILNLTLPSLVCLQPTKPFVRRGYEEMTISA